MKKYLILLRGINVGGKNTIAMAALKQCLEELGYEKVRTYINSGNVILHSSTNRSALQDAIEQALVKNFKLDSELIRVLVLTYEQLKTVIENKPKGFGEEPDTYYSDAIFLMNINTDEAFAIFDPREGVDRVWKGEGVVYSQRLGSERTKSRLNKIISSPLYKSMTIRSWNTTTKLLALMEKD